MSLRTRIRVDEGGIYSEPRLYSRVAGIPYEDERYEPTASRHKYIPYHFKTCDTGQLYTARCSTYTYTRVLTE